MRFVRTRTRLSAVLTLAIFAGGAWVADLHAGHAVGAAEAWEALAFSDTPHDAPDRTLHVEAAIAAEHPSCGACLLRSLSNGTEYDHATDRVAAAGGQSDAGEASGSLAAGNARLPGSRGPPRV